MERINEKNASITTPIAFLRKRTDVFNIAMGIAIKALKIVERQAKAILTPQERKRDRDSMGDGGMT